VFWIYGLHYALSLLVVDIHQPTLQRYGVPTLDALRSVATIAALMWLLSRIGRAIEIRLTQFARRSHSRSDDFFLPIIGTAIRLLLPLLAIILGSSTLDIPDRLQVLFRNGVSMVLVGSIGYVLYRVVGAACDLILERHRIDVPDNRDARAVRTQVTVLRKVAVATIVLFSFAAMLMVFDQVRQIGATILASAGLAGVVLGFAAQRSLGMLLAGFQIALTQPIRIDDSVIVEGEFGNIEEITLTYVVVKLWDERRLIVPITYFLDKPFQNWTRTSVQLLATVELWVDYDFPIEALREKLTSVLNASKLWDKRLNVMQVTDVHEHTVQVRALISAADAGKAFDLRCEVREALLKFLQQKHPESLPRFRLINESSPRDLPEQRSPVSP
jgi:small-conductance mechanosensitive channel